MQKRFWRIGAVATAGFVALSMVVPASHAVGVEVEQEPGSGHIEKSSQFQIIPSCENGKTSKVSITETEKKYRVKLDLKVRVTGELSKPHIAAPFLKVRVNNSYNCTWKPASPVIERFTFKDTEGNPKAALGSTHRFNCDGELDITKDSQAGDLVTVEILGRKTRRGSWKHIATTTPHLANLIPRYQVKVDGEAIGSASDIESLGTIPSDALKPDTKITLEAKGVNDTVEIAAKTLTSSEVCPAPTTTPDDEEEESATTPTPNPEPSSTTTPNPESNTPTPEPSSTTPAPRPEPSASEETPTPEDTPTGGSDEGGYVPSGSYIPSTGDSNEPTPPVSPTPPVAGVNTPAPVPPLPPVAGVNESAPTTPQAPTAPVPPVAGVQETAPVAPETLAKTGTSSGLVAGLAATLILGGAVLTRRREPGKHAA